MILPSLTALIELQNIDRTLIQLKKEAQRIPARKEAMEARCAAEKEALEEAESAFQHNQSAIKQQDLDAEAVREQLNRYKNQQINVKTNEEYKALGHEIEGSEKKISDIEDVELELMEKIEGLKADVAQKKTTLEASQRTIAADQTDLDARMAVIKEQFEELKTQREAFVAKLDERLEATYRALLQSKDGLAVVPVQQGGCGGCHMKLTPQILHDAHAGVKWVSCGYCGRMLYDTSLFHR